MIHDGKRLSEKAGCLDDFPPGNKRGLSGGLACALQIGLYYLVADGITGAVRKTKCRSTPLLRDFIPKNVGTDLVETAHVEGLAENGFGARCLFCGYDWSPRDQHIPGRRVGRQTLRRDPPLRCT